jgi:hypothetical protein
MVRQKYNGKRKVEEDFKDFDLPPEEESAPELQNFSSQ